MAVSMHPKDQVKGGLIGDIDAVLTHLRFENDIYQDGTPSIGLVGELQLDGGDKERVLWSLGKPEDWEILEDGVMIDSAQGRTGFVDNSNAAMLMREMAAAGFPTTNKDWSRTTTFEGLKAHWIRKAQPARSGLQMGGSSTYEKTTLVPEKILLLPGEKGKGKTAAQSSGGGGKHAAASTSQNDLENETALGVAGAVVDLLKSSKAGTHTKVKWATAKLAVMPKADGYSGLSAEDKKAVASILNNAEWLSEFGIAFADDGSVTVPAE